MPEGVSKDINPRIFEQEIGIEDLRKIKIYPLAVGHQLDLSDLISKAIAGFVELNPEDDPNAMVSFVSFILGLIKDNIERIIGYVTRDESVELLKEMDNYQLAETVEKIYAVNFEGPIKKVTSLFLPEEKEGTETLTPRLKRSAQQSVNATAIN